MGAAIVFVPVTGLLLHPLACFDQIDLTRCFVFDGTAEAAQRVDVLDLTACTELVITPAADRHVAVDAHRSLFHLAVGRPDRHEDRPQLGDIRAGLVGVADVGPTDDLEQRHTGTVVVDGGIAGVVDPATAAHMGGLAGVLLQVGPLDADHLARGQLERTTHVYWTVELGDLVVLGQVGIEVVLACEGAGRHLAAERQADPDRQLDRVFVEHG